MLLAFHKPYGVLSQFTPEPGSKHRTLADFGFPERVYPLGRLDAESEGLLLLSDERELPFDAVVLATGYRTGLETFLDDASSYLDENGHPRWHAAPTPSPGLFFIGFRNPITGQLRDIAAEAPRIARYLRKESRHG